MTAEPDLLPCPFCGARADIDSHHDADGCYWARVRCRGCGAASRGKWLPDRTDACPQWYAEVRADWNTRANVAHAVAPLQAEVEELRADGRCR